MTWSLVLSSVELVVLVPLGVLVAVLLLWALNSIVSDVWQLPMLVRLQPWPTSWRLGLVAGSFLFGLGLVLGPGHVIGKMLAAVLLAARPTLWLVRRALWCRTDDKTRSVAAAVRKEIGGREGGAAIELDKPWPSFVFDLERSRRRAEYEPPPI